MPNIWESERQPLILSESSRQRAALRGIRVSQSVNLFQNQVYRDLTDHEHADAPRPFHTEGSAVVFDKPKSEEEKTRQRREDEQHEFARAQVRTNKRLAWFTGLLVLGTFVGSGITIWQATIAQTSATAAKKASETASKQFDMYRQQAEYTEAARVRVVFNIRYPNNNNPEQGITIGIENDGQEHASGVTVSFSLVQKSVRGERVTDTYPAFSISVPYDLMPVQEQAPVPMGDNAHNFSRDWPTHIPDDNFKRVWATHDFLEMQYDLVYFNGFREVREHHCMRYITYFNPLWINSAPSGQFYPCENFQLTVDEVRKQGQQAEAYYLSTQKYLKEHPQK